MGRQRPIPLTATEAETIYSLVPTCERRFNIRMHGQPIVKPGTCIAYESFIYSGVYLLIHFTQRWLYKRLNQN